MRPKTLTKSLPKGLPLHGLEEGLAQAKGPLLAGEVPWVGILDIRPLFDLEPQAEAWLLESLDPSEQKRAERYRFEGDRLRFLAGRVLSKAAVAFFVGCSPKDIVLACDAHGKPFVKAPRKASGFSLSLSHSAHLVAVALAYGGLVGIDIEPWSRSVDIEALSKRFLSPQESLAIQQAGDRKKETFLRTWTLKEAYAKAKGLGIGLPFRDFGLIVGPNQTIRWAPAPPDHDSWQFFSGSLGTDFCLGLCVEMERGLA